MNILLCLLQSFLSLFALMRLTQMQTTNPLSLVLFCVLYYCFSQFQKSHIESKILPQDHGYAGVLSGLFCLFTLAASYQRLYGDMTSGLFRFIILLLSAAGIFLLYHYFLLWLFLSLDTLRLSSMLYPNIWLSIIAFFACLLGWMPYFLHEYPGVMTPDSINQYAQVIGAYELSNHHSIVHTLILGACYHFGLNLTGDIYFGLACYTLFQMIFMAIVAGYVVRSLQKCGVCTGICALVICFYALMPYNGIFAVTLWKDVFFTGNMTLFTACLLRFLSVDTREKMKLQNYILDFVLFVVSGIMICLLRANGWYLFLISVPFVLFTFRDKLKVFIPLEAVILLVVLFVYYPCMTVYEIPQADFVESLSIPVQQVARVVALGETLTEQQTQELSQYMDITQLPALYQEDVSDPVKNLIRSTGTVSMDNNKGNFLSLWFSIGLQHPRAYFDAFIEQTKGFWYPDIANDAGLSDGIYPNEFGLSWQPILKGSMIIKIREILFKLQNLIPLYGLLWSMGAVFWLLLIILVICLRRKKFKHMLLLLPGLALVFTLCIATPVANEFRYAYALFYTLPLYVLIPFL